MKRLSELCFVVILLFAGCNSQSGAPPTPAQLPNDASGSRVADVPREAQDVTSAEPPTIAVPAPTIELDHTLAPTIELDYTLDAYEGDIAAPLTVHVIPGTPPNRYEPPPGDAPNTESYDALVANTFQRVRENPLSTFSIDVDTASYSNVRRFLNGGQLPPPGAVRIEEMVNYFTYDYAEPTDETPIAASIEIAASPWNNAHRLVRIGLQGRRVDFEERPAYNLVFLIDVSGSMNSPEKLPLVKHSLLLLAEQLQEQDRVAIVTYAGSAGIALPATQGDQFGPISQAIVRLEARGSTNGSGGIVQAYGIARRNFIEGGVNRVILATDGDFNVGVTSPTDLVQLIKKEAATGVFLSVLGYGMGNYKDATLEKLADNGNGNYAYVDNISEAQKVLHEQVLGTLIPIAKDVKVQIEFNPARVAAYRLIGYENRLLAKQDFDDDRKDAGDMGAGHSVTALYEVAPIDAQPIDGSVDALKDQQPPALTAEEESEELLTLRIRYKEPNEETSRRLTFPVTDDRRAFGEATPDFQFAAAVAAFGMLLRNEQPGGSLTFDGILEIARSGEARKEPRRQEFTELVDRARQLVR